MNVHIKFIKGNQLNIQAIKLYYTFYMKIISFLLHPFPSIFSISRWAFMAKPVFVTRCRYSSVFGCAYSASRPSRGNWFKGSTTWPLWPKMACIIHMNVTHVLDKFDQSVRWINLCTGRWELPTHSCIEICS